MADVKVRDRLLITVLVVAAGFGVFWVGRAITRIGHEYSRGASQSTTVTTPRASTHSHDRRNLEVLVALVAGGLVFVIVPALASIPRRRHRARWRARMSR
jgi:hypothetical protein